MEKDEIIDKKITKLEYWIMGAMMSVILIFISVFIANINTTVSRLYRKEHSLEIKINVVSTKQDDMIQTQRHMSRRIDSIAKQLNIYPTDPKVN